ncbi:MAG: zinc-binding dehydrogenase, partial [Aggregatilineales bacterium]
MFVEKGKAAIIDEAMPVMDADSMLLKTRYSGLSNGTERSFLMDGSYGHTLPYPKRIAYQHVSEVVECGENITRFKVGDMVFSSTYPGHVEYHVLKDNDLVIKLTPDTDLECAALFGVASVAFHNVGRASVNEADSVLVIGDGLIGQFVAQFARVLGARVMMGGHHDDRLAIAQACGVEAVTNTSHTMQPISDNAPYTVIFECSGADILDNLLELVGVRSHARLVLVAGRFDVRYNFNKAGRAEVNILHTQHFNHDDLENVADLVAQQAVHIRPLIR